MALTLQDIHAAADTIAAAGGNPTLAAVRQALNGGSFTTISEAMKDWKAKHQAQTIIAPLREAAPAAISDRLSAFGTEVWAIALELSNARLQSERESLDLVRQELEQDKRETGDFADQLSLELEQTQALIKQQAADLDTARKELTDKIVELDSEKAVRLTAERQSEVANAALTETHRQIKELRAEIKELGVDARENFKRAVTAESALTGIKINPVG
ncbi:MAG: DNA-binding protein [Methylococcaceae bacterium]